MKSRLLIQRNRAKILSQISPLFRVLQVRKRHPFRTKPPRIAYYRDLPQENIKQFYYIDYPWT